LEKIVYYINDASSFWETLAGSFMGTITAFFIFLLESKREKRKIKDEKKENYKSALIYFKLLLENIIKTTHKQVLAYHEHAVQIKERPLEFNLLRLFISKDVERILNKLDQERLFQAYLQEFGNSVEVIKEFQSVFSILDYFHSISNQVEKSQEIYLSELNDNLLKYKDISEEEVLKNCVRLIEEIKNNNKEFIKDKLYIAFNDIVLHYYQTSPIPPTIENIQNNLIIPIRETIIENFRDNLEASSIADDCRRATWLFNDIIFKANNISAEFNSHYEGMNETLQRLEKLRRIFDLQIKL